MVLWLSRGHRTDRTSSPGDGGSWGGQVGMTGGLQAPGYPESLHALSLTVTLHCSVVTWLLSLGRGTERAAQPSLVLPRFLCHPAALELPGPSRKS